MTGQSESENETNHAVIDIAVNKRKIRNKCEYICSYEACNAVFKRNDRFKTHLRLHYGERPFVCTTEGCNRSFASISYLNKHLKRPHKLSTEKREKVRKRYNCDNCEKNFKTKYQLRLHSFQHTGEKPFKCDKCDKCYANQSKLNAHLKTHDGYRCGRDGCDFICYKWSLLRKHVSLSHKTIYECDECHKKFNNNYNLSLHKQVKHESTERQMHACTNSACNRKYVRRSSLLIHIRRCHQSNHFKCNHEGCDKTFQHKKSLSEHIKNHSNPDFMKPKNKLIRRRTCISTKLTGVEATDSEIKQMMSTDIAFRKELSEQPIDK